MKIKFAFPLAIALTIAFSTQSLVQAQVTDQQRQARRVFISGLLEKLVESQVDRNPQAPRPGQPNLRPAWPGQDFRPTEPLGPNMASARAALGKWEVESTQFVNHLRRHERRLPAVRPILADAMATHAQIKALRSHSLRVHELKPLTDSFCGLDQRWRVLNHQFSRVRGLPADCIQSCERMCGFNDQLGGLFDVQPQFNRRELARQCTAMSTSLQHLMQDIRYDIRSDPNYQQALVGCQRLYSRLNESIALCNRGTYEQVCDVYNSCVQDWRKLKYQLASGSSGRIHRSVHSIETTGAHIADLLWIQAELDREYLCITLEAIQKDAAFAFQGVNLDQMLRAGKPGVLIACSRDFRDKCRVLYAKIKNDVAVEELIWDFQQLSNQWSQLNDLLIAYKAPRIDQACGEVDSGMVVLQGVFGDGPFINRATMTEICGDLEQLVFQFHSVAETRTGRGYEPAFHNQICGAANSMLVGVHQMHEHVIGDRRYDAHAAADVANIMQHWTSLRPMIGKCKPKDRAVLNQLRGRIEPLLVKLQVIFAG